MKLRQSISPGLQFMLSPEALFWFLVGAIALAIMGNAAYELLLSWIGRAPLILGYILIGTLIVLIGSAYILSHLVQRARPNAPLPGKRSPTPRRGLVVLVSRQETLRKALEHHRPALEHCWMVCSGKSVQEAEPIRHELAAEGKHAELVTVNDVYDPVEVSNRVSDIYARLPEGLEETDVILDFTGLTAVASVGAVLACLNTSRPIQYVPANLDKDGKPVGSKDPIEITLDYTGASA